MAAECMVLRTSRVFSHFFTHRSGRLGHHRTLEKAIAIAQRCGQTNIKQHVYNGSLFQRRLYCAATDPLIQQEIHPQIYILSAICIERLPVITPDKTELDKKYEELQDQLELEHSVLSDDEMELKRIMERKKKLTEKDEDENMEIAQFEAKRKEFHEEEEEEFRQFQPASRETEEESIVRSMNRKLQESLVLLVKTEDACWEMPVGGIEDQESLRQAAERRLQETCGCTLSVRFLSNAPAGVLKMAKIKPRSSEKVFFYKAQFLGGAISLGEGYKDFVWVTKNEMKAFLAPEYYKVVRRFIF